MLQRQKLMLRKNDLHLIHNIALAVRLPPVDMLSCDFQICIDKQRDVTGLRNLTASHPEALSGLFFRSSYTDLFSV